MFKKKKSEKNEKGPVGAGYPSQNTGYPIQGAAAPPAQPPPYTSAGMVHGAAPMYGPPGAQPYGYPGGPQGYMPPQAGGPVMYGQPAHVQQPTTYVVQGGFDAGARFDGISQPTIPPPPPGYAPNTAQMATYSGANVVVTQRPAGFWDGGSDGGFTLF